MLDHYLEQAHREQVKTAARDRYVALMMKLPMEELHKIAQTGEVKLAFRDTDREWLDQFKDTPLMPQAIALEEEQLRAEVARDQLNDVSNQERDENQKSRDEIRLHKRLLELELVKQQAQASAAVPLPPPTPGMGTPPGMSPPGMTAQGTGAMGDVPADGVGKMAAVQDEGSPKLQKLWQEYDTATTTAQKLREALSTIGGATTGGVLGGAAGYGIGHLAGNAHKGALIGAGIGGTLGLATGSVVGDSHGESDVRTGKAYERYSDQEDKEFGVPTDVGSTQHRPGNHATSRLGKVSPRTHKTAALKGFIASAAPKMLAFAKEHPGAVIGGGLGAAHGLMREDGGIGSAVVEGAGGAALGHGIEHIAKNTGVVDKLKGMIPNPAAEHQTASVQKEASEKKAFLGEGISAYLGASKAQDAGENPVHGALRGAGGYLGGSWLGAATGAALAHAVGGEGLMPVGALGGMVGGGILGYKALTGKYKNRHHEEHRHKEKKAFGGALLGALGGSLGGALARGGASAAGSLAGGAAKAAPSLLSRAASGIGNWAKSNPGEALSTAANVVGSGAQALSSMKQPQY